MAAIARNLQGTLIPARSGGCKDDGNCMGESKEQSQGANDDFEDFHVAMRLGHFCCHSVKIRSALPLI